MHLPESLQTHRSLIEATLRPCLTVRAADGPAGPLQSRVGGQPVLPSSFELPAYQRTVPEEPSGKLSKLVSKVVGMAPSEGPLHFLAQLNFQEMPALEGFPEKGLLQFYISPRGLFGQDHKRPTAQDGFRVLYFEEPPQPPYLPLENLQTPKGFVLRDKATPLRFELAVMPLSASDYRFEAWNFDDCEAEDYFELVSGEGHRVGGYPGFTQEDPRGSRPDLQDYELLFQLDSDPEMDLMWGDAGVANFFIRAEALRRRDFSDIMYSWDCG